MFLRFFFQKKIFSRQIMYAFQNLLHSQKKKKNQILLVIFEIKKVGKLNLIFFSKIDSTKHKQDINSSENTTKNLKFFVQTL